jgi:putative SOS response-associated peptidase YedK
MCGRFAFYSSHEAVRRLFGVADAPPIEPRYNIAPTQFVAAVRADDTGRRLAMLYWGLVPHWAKDKRTGARMINARSETLKEKPSFRNAYRRRRCLVLADGYYEWQRRNEGKQPFFISAANGEPFGMAGLWETWQGPDETSPLESCTIITTVPADSIAHIHDRMPVIVPADAYGTWLDPANDDLTDLDRLLVPCAPDRLRAYPVSRGVNNARNQGPQLIDALQTAGKT